MHAGTGELVASAIVQAVKSLKLPNGIFSNLNSSGITVGVDLVNHPEIKGVGFTGSISGGRALFDLAAKRPEPIPVFAEMGSVNPVIISNNALINNAEKWSKAYANSITQGNGQFCTSPGLLIAIATNEFEQFGQLLAENIRDIPSQVTLGPSIHRSFNKLKSQAISDESVEPLLNIEESKANYAGQAVVTVSARAFINNPRLHHEVFGPFTMLVKCKNEEEILEVIKSLGGQLTGTIICEENEISIMKPIIDLLMHKVGRLIYNGVSTGVEVCNAMTHGGPYPASTDSRFTAVGPMAIDRWVRPLTLQNFPIEWLD
jgi:NADP-dependent aldehyde dehydrogenase